MLLPLSLAAGIDDTQLWVSKWLLVHLDLECQMLALPGLCLPVNKKFKEASSSGGMLYILREKETLPCFSDSVFQLSLLHCSVFACTTLPVRHACIDLYTSCTRRKLGVYLDMFKALNHRVEVQYDEVQDPLQPLGTTTRHLQRAAMFSSDVHRVAAAGHLQNIITGDGTFLDGMVRISSASVRHGCTCLFHSQVSD